MPYIIAEVIQSKNKATTRISDPDENENDFHSTEQNKGKHFFYKF